MATPTTVRRTDEEVQQDVLAELAWEPRLQPQEIGVLVRDGVVTLTGWVDNYAKKWAAERAAHRLADVRSVANDIEVRLPTSATRLDPDIATAASRALEWDAFVPITQLDVTVANGWVVVRGEVEWEYQKRAAERALRRLSGVRGVTNGITVRPPLNRPTPGELRQRIAAALVRSVEVDAERVEIEIRGDTVVLTGAVRSWLQRQEVERIVWSAPGVAVVDNHVLVRP